MGFYDDDSVEKFLALGWRWMHYVGGFYCIISNLLWFIRLVIYFCYYWIVKREVVCDQ